MKKLIVALVVIIFLVGATPLIGGYIYKNDFDKFIDTLNEDKSTQARVVEYKNGWFSSHAKIVIEPRDNDKTLPGLPKAQITLDQDICHGPFVFDKSHGFLIAEAVVHSQVHFQPFETLLGIPNDQGIMQVNTIVNYNDTYLSQFSAPPFSKTVPQKFSFKWEGFKGNADINMDNDNIGQINSYVDMGPILLDVANGTYAIKISNTSWQNNMKSSSIPGLWNTKHTDKIANISYNAQGRDMFTMDGTTAIVTTNIDNNFFDMVMNVNINRMNFSDQIEIKPAVFNFVVNDISGVQLAKFLMIPHSERKENVDLLPQLITPSSTVKSDLKLETSRGKLKVDASVDWKGILATTKADEIPKKVNVLINVRISNALLTYLINLVDNSSIRKSNPDNKTLQDQITAFINQGYLIPDKEDYTSQITLSQGVIKVNGKDYVVSPPSNPTTLAPNANPVIPSSPSAIDDAQPVGNKMPPTVPAVKPIPTPDADVPIEGKTFIIEQDPRNQT